MSLKYEERDYGTDTEGRPQEDLERCPPVWTESSCDSQDSEAKPKTSSTLLQSPEAMTKTTTCVYHFLVMNWYIFLSWYIPNIGKGEEKLKEFHDSASSKYLTLLNLFLQAVFFGVACLDDVLKRIIGRKDIKFITSFRDLLFTTLAFPVST
ncbi:hypothetical protein STEG23_029310, partial [Scotinomys teguina]